jgi:hypothetical protein
VIVEFTSPNRAGAKVIGFLRNPRKCPVFNGWKIHNGKYVHSSYDPGGQWDWTPNAGAGGNHSWTGGIGNDRCTLSWWGRDGKHCGELTTYTSYVYYNSTALSFPYPVFGAFARKVDGVWWVFAYCRDMSYTIDGYGNKRGTADAEYWYKRKRDGTGIYTQLYTGSRDTTPYAASHVDRSSIQKNSAWANASGTIAVVGYRGTYPDGDSDNFTEYDQAQSFTSACWFEFDGDTITRRWTPNHYLLTSDVSNGVTHSHQKYVLAYEWDNDQLITIWGEWWFNQVLTDDTHYTSDSSIKVYSDNQVFFERTVYGMKDGWYSENQEVFFNIHYLSAVAMAYNYDESWQVSTEDPYVSHHDAKVVDMDGNIVSANSGTYSEPGAPSGNAFAGNGYHWFRNSDINARLYLETAERFYLAAGPDGKHVLDANAWRWAGGASYLWGSYNDSTSRLFTSNDISKEAFESASGATQPYNGRVAVI